MTFIKTNDGHFLRLDYVREFKPLYGSNKGEAAEFRIATGPSGYQAVTYEGETHEVAAADVEALLVRGSATPKAEERR